MRKFYRKKEKILQNLFKITKIRFSFSLKSSSPFKGVSWNSIASGKYGKQVVGNDRGHVKTIIKMLAANNADYSPAPVALAA